MKNLTTVTLLFLLASCSTKNENKALIVEDFTKETAPKIEKIIAEPDSGWKNAYSFLDEILTAPIGKYSEPGDSVDVTEGNTVTGAETIKRVAFNRAQYFNVNMIIFDSIPSSFCASFNPSLGKITLNRFQLRNMYRGVDSVFRVLNAKKIITIPIIPFNQFASAILQQELWHARGGTGNDKEFYSDVVSIKIAGEWFLYESLVNLISYHSGVPGPDTYKEQFAKYDTLFLECGVSSSELQCASKEENFKDRATIILKEHPGFLTKLKEIIVARY